MAGNTRRGFVRAATVAGLGAAAARPRETLAINGGPKAVNLPAGRIDAITKWPRYGSGEKQAVLDLLESNRYYQEIPLLETELREYLKIPYVKAHCNGTSALMSMFFALDLPPGSEILVPSYTAWATVAPMQFFGYVPAFVDIHPRTACFDLEDAARRVTPHTRAMVVMHSWGLPCDMDEVNAFARKHGLIVTEDAAQAVGASLQGKPMGTWGAIGAFSFQTSKTLPAVEGGAGMYHTREHYERAVTFGNYDLPGKFPADSPYRRYAGTGMGPKLRIHPLAAALARVQLRGMDRRNALVDVQARKLGDRLVELPGVSRQHCRPDAKRVYWASQILFLDESKAGCAKDALVKALQAEGVRIQHCVYEEQHKYALYSEHKWWRHPPEIPQNLPGTTQVNRTAVRLPLFYEEAPELIEQYSKAFEKVWAHRSQLGRS
jgi:dTDP-4-amino-4,6-dideoxygalactose transaminase